MKTIAIIAVVGLAAAVLLSMSSTSTSTEESQFREFLNEYRVGYANSNEYSYRLSVFKDNLKKIDELNRLNPQATFAVNKFADRTPAEMEKMMGLIVAQPTNVREVFTPSLAKDQDWTDKMWKVKDQGQCGSCWAFSAVAAVEGGFMVQQKKQKVDVDFAEQQLVDCDPQSQGCNGGWMDWAFDYFTGAGFMKESDYKYTARTSTCKADASKFVGKLSGHVDIPAGNVDALITALQDRPVSVAVDASTWSWYSGGVLSNCGSSLNHGVTLVGSSSGVHKIRNSWGSSWGEKGHIRLAVGNTCGVANVASYPTF